MGVMERFERWFARTAWRLRDRAARELCERLRESMRLPRVAGVLCPDAGWRRLLEVIHQPPSAYRYRRQMTAAEAIWRIAKESYGAHYEREDA